VASALVVLLGGLRALIAFIAPAEPSGGFPGGHNDPDARGSLLPCTTRPSSAFM